MRLEQHITALTRENDMVIIPSLGGVVAHYREAVVVPNGGVIQPPGKSYSFNPKLTYQDGLLVQSYMQDSDISQNEALIEVNLAVLELKKQLASSESIVIESVGTFKQNSEGHIQLFDNLQDNEAFEMFGLAKIQFEKLNKKKEQAPQNFNAKEKLPVVKIKEIKKKNSYQFGKWIAAAAVFLLMFLVSKPVSDEKLSLNIAGPSFDFLESRTMVIAEKHATSIEIETTSNTHLDENISILPEPPLVKYCIVVSSLANKKAADKKLAYYTKAGFKNASIIKGNGRYRISIGSFSNKEIGIKKLNEIRSFSSRYKDAWLLKNNS